MPYLGSLTHPLLHDDRTLLDNPWLARDAGLATVFAQDYWHGTRHDGSDLYRPLTILTLAWNAHLAHGSFGYRATNLALHAAVALLVALFARKVIRSLDPGSGDQAEWGGLLAGAIFAVHPLASEAVLTAVGRSELLAAGLGLAAFLALPSLVLATALFFLALCAKESAAAWAGIVPVFLAMSRRSRPRSHFLGSVPVFVALAGFVLLRGSVIGRTADAPPWIDNPLVRVDAITRIANAILLQGRYFLSMVFPLRLSVDYGFDQIPVVPLVPWGALGALAILGTWSAVLVLLFRRSRAAAFFWIFVPAAFAVTGNFILPIGTILGERLAYLPLAGFCGLAGYGLVSLPWPPPRTYLTSGILLAILATRIVFRAEDFRGLAALNEATAAASPRSVKALANEGRTLLRTGNAREAVEPLERAVAIWPDYARALDLLSQAYAMLGDRERAADYHDRAITAAKAVSVASPDDD